MEQNEQEKKLNTPVGTIEPERLTAAEVTILGQSVVEQTKKETGKKVGDKVVCHCKHPDKEDPIEISTVRFEKNSKLKTTGLWYQLDKEGHIQKGSALSVFMNFMKIGVLKDLTEKKCMTAVDEQGYLCFKAY